MLETLWLLVLPATELARGEVESTSALCQVSGFLLLVGIEACDLSVLLMALHTGLYIFRGRSGLYPYRRIAFATVVTVSVLLASLAFVNKPAFVNLGAFCLLPTQHSWTNRALSWIPRYIVVVTVIITYTFIYIYVACAMTDTQEYSRLRHDNASLANVDQLPFSELDSLPPIPCTAHHGLLPRTPSDGMAQDASGRASAATRVVVRKHRPLSRIYPIHVRHGLSPFTHFRNNKEANAFGNSWHAVGGLRQTIPACLLSAAATAPSPYSTELADLDLQGSGHQPAMASDLADFSPMDFGTTDLSIMRGGMRRQLRQLFVYPVVYTVGWLIPWVLHITGGDKTGRPFGLVLAGLVSLCLQGLADSIMFLVLEKPWQFRRRNTNLCHHGLCDRSMTRGSGARVGRTREEMLIDGALARRRRDQENAERKGGQSGRMRQNQDWWDAAFAAIDEPDYHI